MISDDRIVISTRAARRAWYAVCWLGVAFLAGALYFDARLDNFQRALLGGVMVLTVLGMGSRWLIEHVIFEDSGGDDDG